MGSWGAESWDYLISDNSIRGGITSCLYISLRLLMQSKQNIHDLMERISSCPSLQSQHSLHTEYGHERSDENVFSQIELDLLPQGLHGKLSSQSEVVCP